MAEITITPPERQDYADWRSLYQGYATFYERPMTEAIALRVWDWLFDPSQTLEALVAREKDGKVVGLAHFRAMPRPLAGSLAGFLDDLFVDPAYRGQRVADRLIEGVAAIGRERGWGLIRWLTADDNYRARGVYDRVAARTLWITYQLDL